MLAEALITATSQSLQRCAELCQCTSFAEKPVEGGPAEVLFQNPPVRRILSSPHPGVCRQCCLSQAIHPGRRYNRNSINQTVASQQQGKHTRRLVHAHHPHLSGHGDCSCLSSGATPRARVLLANEVFTVNIPGTERGRHTYAHLRHDLSPRLAPFQKPRELRRWAPSWQFPRFRTGHSRHHIAAARRLALHMRVCLFARSPCHVVSAKAKEPSISMSGNQMWALAGTSTPAAPVKALPDGPIGAAAIGTHCP